MGGWEMRFRNNLLALTPVFLFTAMSFIHAQQAQPVLQPAPREASFGALVSLENGVTIDAPGNDAEDNFAAAELREALHAAHINTPVAAPFTVHLLRSGSDEGKLFLDAQKLTLSPEMHDEGYALVVSAADATIIADTGAGIFYGVQTFKQMLPLPGEKPEIAQAVIRDWPAMRYRGIDDDLSRGPFPTLAFIKHQIRVFASFKANVYSPYFEHTLQYAENPLAAPPGGSLSEADAAELVRYAAKYHITVVPEQESFGHLHHQLKYDLYSDLAETPHGHVLAPGEAGTIPLIKSWFTQIAKEFPGPFMHIGADEVFELGQGKTSAAMKTNGYGATYIDFLTRIHDALAPLNKRLLFWGDIGGDDPAAVAKVPKDMIAVPWNYDRDTDFIKMLEPFKKNGIETWVASGAGNYGNVYTDYDQAFPNIQKFIRDGQKMGSTGSLVTVWDDDGEGLFQEDWYGVLFAAAAAWQPGESSIPKWQASYGRLFHGDGSGQIDQAERELLAIFTLLRENKVNGDSDQLFWSDPFEPDGRKVQEQLTPLAREIRIHAENAIVLVEKARRANPALQEQQALDAIDLGARRFDLIGMKAEFYNEIATTYNRVRATENDKTQLDANENLYEQISGANGKLEDIRDAYSLTKDLYRQLWLSENTQYSLNIVLARYDIALERWERRCEQIEELRGLVDEGNLPPPETLGLPPAGK